MTMTRSQFLFEWSFYRRHSASIINNEPNTSNTLGFDRSSIHPSRECGSNHRLDVFFFRFDVCSSRLKQSNIEPQLKASQSESQLKSSQYSSLVVSNQAEMEPRAQPCSNAGFDAVSTLFLSSQDSFWQTTTPSEFELKIECNAIPQPKVKVNNQHQCYNHCIGVGVRFNLSQESNSGSKGRLGSEFTARAQP
jgi:hypothetical protein